MASLSGYGVSGGSFRTYLSQLKVAGAIEYPTSGTISLGVDVAAVSLDEARNIFRSTLTGPQTKFVEALRSGECSRDVLSARTGYEASGGSYRTYLSQLKTMELITYPDERTGGARVVGPRGPLMEIGRIQGTTRVIGKSQGYLGLPLRDITINDAVTGPGTPAMETAWLPNPDELAAIAAGGPRIVRSSGPRILRSCSTSATPRR